MTSASIQGHIKLGRKIVSMVWFGDSVALKAGEGVCYNDDYGTATDATASRALRVEKPSVANSGHFAGVAVRSYSAKTGGQFIEIYEPGSQCVPVALSVDTVINTGLLTFVCAGRYNIAASTGLTTDAGRFVAGKFRGRGSAIPRQTKTALLEEETDGTGWSLATDGVTLTVADSSDMAAGDTVVLHGGEDDGTGTVIPGKYPIASITDGTTIVLSSSAVDVTPGAALTCIGVIYTGNPTAICDLLDGEESHGVEFLNPPNAGSGAMPHKTLGLTYVQGGITLAADCDVDLAQGVLPGDKTAFILLGAMTTNDFTVDLVTAGIQQDGSSALAEVNALDAAADACYLEFHGATWHTLDLVGGATQA
jgi:hypothetical protein